MNPKIINMDSNIRLAIIGVFSTPDATVPSPRNPTAPKYTRTSARQIEPIGPRPNRESSEEDFNLIDSLASLPRLHTELKNNQIPVPPAK